MNDGQPKTTRSAAAGAPPLDGGAELAASSGKMNEGEGEGEDGDDMSVCSSSSSSSRDSGASIPFAQWYDARSRVEYAYASIANRLRSVLFHPAALPLAVHFNERESGEGGGGGTARRDDRAGVLRDYVPDEVRGLLQRAKESSLHDSALSASYAAWKERSEKYHRRQEARRAWKERARTPARQRGQHPLPKPNKLKRPCGETLGGLLAATIRAQLAASGPTDGVRVVQQQRHNQSDTNWYDSLGVITGKIGQIDVLLGGAKRIGGSNESASMLLGVGVDTSDWWQVAYHTIVNYREATNEGPFQKGPVLLAILDITTAREEKLPSSDFRSSKLALFLCSTSKSGGDDAKDDDFKLALLWRQAYTSLDVASRGIGNALRTACLLPSLLDEVNRLVADFESFGPSCCRYGEKVLRAYDTRFQSTTRRPDLYALVPATQSDVEVVCRISDREYELSPSEASNMTTKLIDIKLRDARPKITGREYNNEAREQKRQWLWQQESGRLDGELVIIRVPFITGNHFASQLTDFIPIVRSLQEVHAAGCVHGDIRCFNVVFGKCLIDFDLGGLVDSDDPPRYPQGYERLLSDGRRMGREGEIITMAHDWYALIQVIFEFHRIHYPRIALDVPGGPDSHRRQELMAMIERQDELRDLYELDQKELAELPHKLITFLNDAEDARWEVKLGIHLRRALESCGLDAGGGV